jgi:hypothetical protein
VSFTGITRNDMGTQTLSSATFTYAVAGDGASTATIGGNVFPGGVVAGGALAIWGGPTTAGGPALIVVVRAATSATLATLSGDYWFVRVARNVVTGDYLGITGTLTADGLGNYTVSATTNNEGSIAEGSTASTYTVAADGVLVLSFGQPNPGGITQDGRFAILGGALGPLAPPAIGLLVRK